jgi:hypothetical protein
MEEKRNFYKVFVGKSEGSRPLGRSRYIGGSVILKYILEK